ncbi:DBH-like monooxygenase protein 1 [Glandiceps talaboti]
MSTTFSLIYVVCVCVTIRILAATNTTDPLPSMTTQNSSSDPSPSLTTQNSSSDPLPSVTTQHSFSTQNVSVIDDLSSASTTATSSSTPGELYLTTAQNVYTTDNLLNEASSPTANTMDNMPNDTTPVTPSEFTTLGPTTVYYNSITLDQFGIYTLYWKFYEDRIQFEIHVRTLGYVGLGFSPTGGMTNADIVIGWVKDGVAYLSDRFATGHGEPTIDESQDYKLVLGRETNTHTILVFTRKMNTCDYKDSIISDGTMQLIWSFSDIDPQDEVGLPYHGITQRGSKSVFLLDISGYVDLSGVPIDTLNLQNSNITVPADQERTYWCQIFKMPDEYNTKHHVVKYTPIISEGNEGVVSQMFILICSGEFDDSYVGFGYQCYSSDKPDNASSCTVQISSWTAGSSGFYFPLEAGYSLFDYANGDARYLLLGTVLDHGWNSSITDASGIQLHFTSQLREYDASIMEVGSHIDDTFLIPPGVRKFETKGYCSVDCTLDGLFNTTVYVFASMLSAGRTALSVKTRQYRNGREIRTLGEDSDYDNRFINIRRLKRVSAIYPGDNLETECKYDSTFNKRIYYGGLTRKTERCVTYLYYYPRVPLAYCESSLNWDYALYRLAGITELSHDTFPPTVIKPLRYAGKSAVSILEGLEWTKDEVNILEEAYQTAFNSHCENEDTTFYKSQGKFSYVPIVTDPTLTGDECGSTATLNSAYWLLLVVMAMSLVYVLSDK